jgi:hypothetical protein
MERRIEKETLKVEDAEDLVEAIRYFYVREWEDVRPALTFPDGLPLVSLTHVRRTFEDGITSSELIFSDECPEDALPTRSYSYHKMGRASES